jgi:hypothetical protein
MGHVSRKHALLHFGLVGWGMAVVQARAASYMALALAEVRVVVGAMAMVPALGLGVVVIAVVAHPVLFLVVVGMDVRHSCARRVLWGDVKSGGKADEKDCSGGVLDTASCASTGVVVTSTAINGVLQCSTMDGMMEGAKMPWPGQEEK